MLVQDDFGYLSETYRGRRQLPGQELSKFFISHVLVPS